MNASSAEIFDLSTYRNTLRAAALAENRFQHETTGASGSIVVWVPVWVMVPTDPTYNV